jgi:pilus assembly protein Flp/PilA
MTTMMKSLKALMQDDSGATAIEYGLLLALISLALIAGASVVGTQIDALFTDVSTKLPGVANDGN